MKRAVSIMIAVTILGCAMTACGRNRGINTNSVFKEKGMVTIDGSEYKDTLNQFTYADKGLGFGITYAGAYGEAYGRGLGGVKIYPYCLALQYANGKANEIQCSVIDPANLSDENIEIFSELLAHEKTMVAGVFRYPAEKASDTESCFEKFNGWFARVDKICELNGDVYYLGHNDGYSKKMTLTEDEKAFVSGMFDEIKEFKKGICIFPCEAAAGQSGSALGSLSNFTAATLDGQTVTQDILKGYDLTMVNIWATWCGACVSELPELSKLYARLPENVNMLTICTDCSEERELANEIYKSANGNFPVLFQSDDIRNSLTKNVQTLPTTVFVDSGGNIVGRSIVGAPRGDVAEYYLNAINEALRSL